MAKFIINHEDAIKMHQDYHSKNFEVIEVTRSGSWDVFPFSLVYGVSDVNGWQGLMSTDGEKIVITKGGMLKSGVVKEKWELSANDIKSTKVGIFKTRINLHKKIPGLSTMSAYEGFINLFMFIVPFLMYNSKKVNFRKKDSFKNINLFNELIPKKSK